MDDYKFDVFISYSRRDAAFARRLQKALDGYAPPRDLAVPQRRLRVFRDESDFRGNEYGTAVESILTASETLLVICSPNSRASAYVGGEIATFAGVRHKDRIVSAIIAGYPNNEVVTAEQPKAFHEELVSRLPVPLAADYRGFDEKRDRVERDRFENAWFKLLSDIYAGHGVERSAIEGREKARQRRARRLRTAVASAIIAVLSALTIWALVSRSEAIRQGNTARSRFLAVQSMSGGHALDVAMLLGVAAYRTSPTFEAWEALFVALQRQPALERFLYGADGTVSQLTTSRDGRCVVGWIDREHSVIWDLQAGASRARLAGEALLAADCASALVVAKNGDVERRAIDRGDAVLWSAASGGDAVIAAAVDPAGATILTAHASGQLVVRDTQDGRVRVERSAPGAGWRYVRFSGDGMTIVAVDQDAQVHRMAAATLQETGAAAQCGTGSPDVFAVSPDLRWCAAGGPGNFAVSDLTRPGAEAIDFGTDWVLALDFSPDGQTLLAGLQGGDLQRRSVADIARDAARARSLVWSEHRTDVTALAYASDGHVVSAARDRTVIAWNPAAASRLVSEFRAPGQIVAASIAPDATAVAVAGRNGDVHVSPIGASGEFVRRDTVAGGVTAIALANARDTLVGTEDGRVLLLSPGQAPRTLIAEPAARIERLRVRDDGASVGVAYENGRVSVLDLAGNTSVLSFEPGRGENRGGGGAHDLAFEPAGTRVLSIHGGQNAFLWDTHQGADSRRPIQMRPTSFFSSVAFARGGLAALGTGIYEEEIVLLNVTPGGESQARLPSHNLQKVGVTAMAFSHDARLLLSGMFDGAIAAWDVAGRRRIGEIQRATGQVTELRYSPDSTAAAAVTERGEVLRWDLDPARWLTMACGIANRDVSEEERSRFLDGAGDLPVCR